MSDSISWTKKKSVRFRYSITLLVNIVKIVLSFIGGIIIARILGPARYGNYNFLLGSFTSIAAFLNMGSTTAFYTFVSRKKRGWAFYRWYFLWVVIQFLVLFLLICFIFPDSWRNRIWLGHSKNIIVPAFLASFAMNTLWLVIVQAGESIRQTVVVQLHNVTVFFAYLCVIVVLAFLRQLTIQNLFFATAVLYFVSTVLLAVRLKQDLFSAEHVSLREVVGEFAAYCTPLVVFNIVSFVYSFADIWFLQKFGGAVQQGYYAVGLRFSVICLLATTSILNIFWKEITAAYEQGNKERLHELYMRISRGLCFISAAGGCFLIPFSKEILGILLGPRYEAGWLCVSIMFLYPVVQSLGQISTSYLLATERTRIYSLVNIIMMGLSIPLSYILLAPRNNFIPGFSLGSVGMAFKMVVLQLINVNVLMLVICRISLWKFDISYQFTSIGLLLFFAFIIKGISGLALNVAHITLHPFAVMASCLPLYALLIALTVYFFPGICGLHKQHVESALNFANSFLKKPFRG